MALIVDYAAFWVTDIQPQSAHYSGQMQVLQAYSCLRCLGLDIDICHPDDDLSEYALVVAPCLPIVTERFVTTVRDHPNVLLGPRTGSRTPDFQIPGGLPPGDLQSVIDLKVTEIDAFRREETIPIEGYGHAHIWLETVATVLEPKLKTIDGRGILYGSEGCHYLSACVDDGALMGILEALAISAGLSCLRLPETVRVRRTKGQIFVFGYGESVDVADLKLGPDAQDIIWGSEQVSAGNVTVLRRQTA